MNSQHSLYHGESKGDSRETSTSVLLTTLKPLNVCITTNCRKTVKRWEYETTWSVSWDHLPNKLVSTSESCSIVSDSLRSHGLYRPYSEWNSPGQNTGVGSFSLLQGIFPTQGLNPGLPHCRQILYQLSHQGRPRILEWVTYPFSSGASRPRNWTGVFCIAGGFFTSWATREALCALRSFTRDLLRGWGASFRCPWSLSSSQEEDSATSKYSHGTLFVPLINTPWPAL